MSRRASMDTIQEPEAKSLQDFWREAETFEDLSATEKRAYSLEILEITANIQQQSIRLPQPAANLAYEAASALGRLVQSLLPEPSRSSTFDEGVVQARGTGPHPSVVGERCEEQHTHARLHKDITSRSTSNTTDSESAPHWSDARNFRTKATPDQGRVAGQHSEMRSDTSRALSSKTTRLSEKSLPRRARESLETPVIDRHPTQTQRIGEQTSKPTAEENGYESEEATHDYSVKMQRTGDGKFRTKATYGTRSNVINRESSENGSPDSLFEPHIKKRKLFSAKDLDNYQRPESGKDVGTVSSETSQQDPDGQNRRTSGRKRNEVDYSKLPKGMQDL